MPAAPPQQNWLQEWAARTPVVCRYLIFSILGATSVSWIISMSTGGGNFFGMIPVLVVLQGEVWRILTSIFAQDGILTLLIVMVMLATQLPPMEVRRGSLPFLVHTLSSALLINAATALLGTLLFFIPWSPMRNFGVIPSLGMWPVLLMLIAEDKLLDPESESPFLCFRVSNKLYAWVLALVFSAFSLFPLLDLFVGVALGHAR